MEMQVPSIPVYIFCGLLDAGKTTFIREILSDPDFTEDEKSVLITCEQGEEQMSEDELYDYLTVPLVVRQQQDLNIQMLHQVVQNYSPDRILIELNGMWKLADVEMALPAGCNIYQIVAIVNAQTFELYQNNLGPMLFDQISNADLIVFNRCTDALKQMLYKKNIRAMNPRATIYLDDEDGNSEDYAQNMPLPFDVSADTIALADTDFGLWYIDAMREGEKYEGKTISFLAQVMFGKKLPENAFVPGRLAMVCCADDIKFLGFLCWYEGAQKHLSEKDWVRVTAKITVEKLPQYREAAPVLHAVSVEPAEAPRDEIVYFS